MQQGTLFVVATPIGNLEDFSPRACRILDEVDLVVAEDTRQSRKLMQHFGITTRLHAMHEHNEAAQLPGLLGRLSRGEDLAVISDAGTPLISDPGFRLVGAALDQGIAVRTVPGPSAVTAALAISGLPTDRFRFEGFLPARAAARKARIESWREEQATLVCFEARHRILATLEVLAECFGDSREVVLCRELTKRFETVLRGSAMALRQRLEEDPEQQKGEFVLLLGAASESPEPDLAFALNLAQELTRDLPASKAARVAARITGVSRRLIFDQLES